MVRVYVQRRVLNARLRKPYACSLDLQKSPLSAFSVFRVVAVLQARLHSFYSILGNTVRHVNNCAFTNRLLVTLGGTYHSGGEVSVALN